MTDNHPITPPLKLFREWTEYRGTECEDQFWWRIATQAANWGANTELEACCADVHTVYGKRQADWLRSMRRPKPPSLKEQALAALDDAIMRGDCITISDALPTIRRALESLPD